LIKKEVGLTEEDLVTNSSSASETTVFQIQPAFATSDLTEWPGRILILEAEMTLSFQLRIAPPSKLSTRKPRFIYLSVPGLAH
jgi:hypothetical protein